MNIHSLEPTCPEPGCGSRVDRPKCLWELGGDCPRHSLMREWEQSIIGQQSKRFDKRDFLWSHMENTKPTNSDRNPPEMRATLFRIYADNEVYQGA